MALDGSGTILELDGIDLADYSARGLTLQVTPLDTGPLIRDANGTLHDLTIEQFRKYSFTITCEDTTAPELTDVWKGKAVSITILPNTGLPGDTAGEREFDCMLSSWETSTDEWGAMTSWSLTLLQV
jgi:hypothetical protein